MKYPYFRGQATIPLQRIFQSHADGRYQDQGKQSGESQPPYHCDGKRRTDRTGIFRIPHRQREHSHDGRNRSDQDRADTRQAGCHQRPIAAVSLPA